MPVDPDRETWKAGMTWEDALDEIAYLKELASEMGGPSRKSPTFWPRSI